jgi:intein/homing endonuclease
MFSKDGVNWSFYNGDRTGGSQAGTKNPARAMLERLGVWGLDSKTKVIPSVIFELKEAQIARFLNLFFACDGNISRRSKNTWSLEMGLANEVMTRQLSSLLMKFGIRGAIRHKVHATISKQSGKPFESWSYVASTPVAIQLFADRIGCVGKEQYLSSALACAAESRGNCNSYLPIPYEDFVNHLRYESTDKGPHGGYNYSVARDLPSDLGESLNSWRKQSRKRISEYRFKALRDFSDGYFDPIADGDIAWEEVTSVELADTVQTWDLTVEGNHNFVAEGMITHNTRLALSELINQAAGGPKRKVWYISPSYKMSKQIMWDDLLESIPRRWIKKVHHTEMWVKLINKSSIELKGADNPDSLRGVGLFYVVLDEFQDIKADTWTKVIRPTLAKDRGKALFIGCVTGDTKVLPQAGMNPIESLSSGSAEKTLSPIDLPLFGIHNEFHSADGFWNNGVVDTKRIKTQFGFALEASHRHPILAMTERGTYDWRRSDAVKPGDRVAIARGMNVWGGKDPLTDWPAHIEDWRATQTKSYTQGPRATQINIDAMNDDLAYFLGLWTAEGSYEEKIGRLTITCGDASVGPLLTSGRVAGVKFKARTGRDDQWVANSYELIELMRYLKMPLVKAPKKFIADWVMQGRREWAAEFVAGMWDGDGCVCDPLKKHDATYISSSERLTSDLQLLLSNFGIIARKTMRTTPPTERVKVSSDGHRLTIYARNLARFRDNITLRIERKQKNLDAQPVSDKSNRDGIPFAQELLSAFKAEVKSVGYGIKSSDFSQTGKVVAYDKLIRVLAEYPLAKCPARDELEQLISDFYFWDEVVGVTDGHAQTYDFTIPETHSFWSNGFISHNTPKGYANLYDVYKLGKDDRKRQWKSWQFPTISSPFIPEEEIEAAREDMDPKSFRQEFMASFESMSGRVYHSFDRNEHVGNYPFNPDLPIWVGQDFNVDPMSSAIMQPQPNGDVWVVDEIILRNSSTAETCDELERRYWRYADKITIFPDPAGGNRSSARGESDLDIFREKGFRRLKFKRKHPLVADRVNSVNRQLMTASGRIRFRVNEKCRETIKGLEETLYKAGTREVDKKAGVEHVCDGIGYCIDIERPMRKIEVMGISI